MSLILLHDGTFDGILTAVFESYADSPPPAAIQPADGCQQQLDTAYREVATDPDKVTRVIEGITARIGQQAYELVWQASRSADPAAGDAIYRYIRLGMRVGGRIHTMLTDPHVLRLQKVAALVGREAGALLQFVRFAELENGLYYAEIEPENRILPILMPHFAGRFNTFPFILHDKVHGEAGVYDLREWTLVEADEVNLPAYSASEREHRRLWKTFYDTVAIKERISERRRMQHMPKKYWKHILEMQLLPEEHAPKLPGTSPDALPGSLPNSLPEGAANALPDVLPNSLPAPEGGRA